MDQMEEFYKSLSTLIWENGEILALIGGVSLLLFAGTIIVMPLLIISIPRDYFVGERSEPYGLGRRHPLIRITVLVLKNLSGLVFIAAGFVMLFIPGQGLLTMFIGVLLLNFPGKRRLELKLVEKPKIKSGLNWIRRRAGRLPLH